MDAPSAAESSTGAGPADNSDSERVRLPRGWRKPCMLAYSRAHDIYALDLADGVEKRITRDSPGDGAAGSFNYCPTLVTRTKLLFLRRGHQGERISSHLWQADLRSGSIKEVSDTECVGLGYDPRTERTWVLRPVATPDPQPAVAVRVYSRRGDGPLADTGMALSGVDVSPYGRLRFSSDGSLVSGPSLSGNPDSAYRLMRTRDWAEVDTESWPTWFKIDIDGYAFSEDTVYATSNQFLSEEPGGGVYEVDLSRGPRAMIAPFRKPRGIAVSRSNGTAIVEEDLPQWPPPAEPAERPPSRLFAVDLDSGLKVALVEGEDPDIWPT